MKASFWLSVLVIAVGTGSILAGVKVALEDVPAPAVKTIKDRFPKAAIRFVDKESKDRYEFAMKEGDRTFDVGVTAAGKLLNIKEEIDKEKLPAAVKETLKKKFSGAKLIEAEKIIKGDGKDAKETYELVIKTDKDSQDVEIDAAGMIVGDKD
jgi:tRNA U38,U39,U40 pseudouridine synthase TruA